MIESTARHCTTAPTRGALSGQAQAQQLAAVYLNRTALSYGTLFDSSPPVGAGVSQARPASAMAEQLGPPRGLAGAPGAGMNFPIIRGSLATERKTQQKEAVPSMGGAMVYYTVRL